MTIVPLWYLHGTLGLIIAIIVAPIAHDFFFPRIMLNVDGTFKDKKKIERNLKQFRKPKVQ